ncbi:DUF1543 domain-containing protein [Pedobacter sp. ASV12]|uniref:DUF1543 domain-containing protein n=1 Tax=Pedobacter sp. ASV12 TaxID=2795120 RepID=UPI0018EC9DAD|nr:DUF1543 domain-containing protein [Pedobacter sp. ASV12]
MQNPQLFMVLLGCRPARRHTEQHDVFFGIANSLKELVPEMVEFWPEAKGKIHIDAWRVVSKVGNYRIEVVEKGHPKTDPNSLFFLNLGGYRKNEFDELHYKMLVVADQKAVAIATAKETAFYKQTWFDGASSHIDDKYGVDVDDIFEIEDILSSATKKKYALKFTPGNIEAEDEITLGYFPLAKIVKGEL